MKLFIKKYAVPFFLLMSFASFSQESIQEKLPGAYRNAAPADTITIADIKWKEFFTETDLQKMIDMALSKNNDLQVADKNIAIANLQFRQAKWNNIPQVNAFVSAGSSKLSENSLNGINAGQALGQHHIEDYSAGLDLSWEADIWGKFRNTSKSARAGYMQTLEARKALQTAIVANVSKGFYDLLMLDAQLEIAKKTLALNDSTLFVVKLQYEAGGLTSLAIQQSEAQRLVAAQLIPQLEQNIQLQENALSTIIGTFPDAKERSSKLDIIEVRDNLSAGIPTQLLSKRPDVKSAELALVAANARVGIAKASFYPSLNIVASGGVNSYEINNWFNLPGSIFASVAGGITAPLLNSKKIRTRYEISKLEKDQAALKFKQTVLVAVAEVADALARADKQEQQFAITKQRVGILQKAITNADMLFKNGMATYLEVIVAQADLLQAELELAAVKKNRLVSNVDLYRALGGGWE